MKLLRPISLTLAVLALCSWSTTSNACDQNKAKGTSASSASMTHAQGSCPAMKGASATTASSSAKTAGAEHVCTAEMAANCTPEMAAACAAKGAKSAKFSNANNMSADCCMSKGAKNTATSATMGGASNGKVSAMTADAGGSCAAHGMKNTAMAAGAEGSCAAHGMKNTATAAGAGDASCGGKGMVRASGHSGHGNCDACADMDACDMALREMGAVMQVVPLKNGVMYVYTTDPSKARAVQSAMAQRKDQMALFASSGTSAHLCDDCKQMRGAAMSGKLTREVVNIEGGCLTLMTSGDPAIVAKIHALAGVSAMARAKI